MKIPPKFKSLDEAYRRIANAINAHDNGKTSNTGSFTVTANQATTQVTDVRASVDSVIVFSPTTANAAAEVATMYVSTKANGSFTVTHANNAQTDRDFDYTVTG